VIFTRGPDIYALGQYGALAQLLPHSAIMMLVTGTVILGLSVRYPNALRKRLGTLPQSVRWAMIVALLLEAIPAFAVALGIGAMFGAAYVALVADGNEGIGLLFGVPWGFATAFIAMETLAALIAGGAAAFSRRLVIRLARA
jgi:hypothetical protein